MDLTIRPGVPADVAPLAAADPVDGRDAQIGLWCQAGSLLSAELPDGGIVGYCVLEYTFFGHGFVAMLMVAESHRKPRRNSPCCRWR
jgi:hypothetical protein